MKQSSTFLLLCFAALLLGQSAHAQATSAEARLPAAAETIQKQYAASAITEPIIYSGPEYADYTRKYHTRTGHPYFLQPKLQPGSASYNNRDFTNLQIQYDLVLDQVVLAQPSNSLRLRLLDDKLRSFSVDGHRFVRLVADSASADVIRTGYYELLADGPVQVLAKRSKTLYERLNKPYVDVSFVERSRAFMQKAGHYYAVRSKGAAMRLLADQGPAMQQYLKEHDLRFGKSQLESSLVELARYYNGLSPK